MQIGRRFFFFLDILSCALPLATLSVFSAYRATCHPGTIDVGHFLRSNLDLFPCTNFRVSESYKASLSLSSFFSQN